MKQHTAKRILFTALTLFFLIFSAGCGKNSPQKEPGQTEPATGEQSSGDMSFIEGEKMYFQEYQSLPLKETEEAFDYKQTFHDTYDGRFYMLNLYQNEGNAFYTMYVVDAETCKVSKQPFSLKLPEGENIWVKSMDILPDGTFSFRILIPESTGDLLIRTDSEGNTLEEAPFPDAEKYPWNPEFSLTEEYWKVFDDSMFGTILSLSDPQTGSVSLFRFNRETGVRSTLGNLKGNFPNSFISDLCFENETTVYYILDGMLCRWDLTDNTVTKLTATVENGVKTTSLNNNLLRNEKGELIFCEISSGKIGVYRYSTEIPEQTGEIHLGRMTPPDPLNGNIPYVSPQIAELCKTNPDINIIIDQAFDEVQYEAYRDRFLTELSVGKGPELFWVDEDDMRMLYERGYLREVSDLISEDIKEQLFPGVLQMGTLDGQLIGIAPKVIFRTLITQNHIWESSSWTLTEFLDVCDRQENMEKPLINVNSSNSYSASLLFQQLLIDYTGLVDLKNGTCDFDQEDFRRFVAFCKKYGENASDAKPAETNERVAMLREGRAVVQDGDIYRGLHKFSELMSYYGDGESHFVGFPGQNSQNGGTYMTNPTGYLVVNRNATHTEEIQKLIAHLLGYESQFLLVNCSVRRDTTRDVVEGTNGQYSMKTDFSSDICFPLDTKPDGTSYLEEYLALAESCVPYPYTPEDLLEIIRSEVNSYFEDEKTLDEAIPILQNRVQLYLNENR